MKSNLLTLKKNSIKVVSSKSHGFPDTGSDIWQFLRVKST